MSADMFDRPGSVQRRIPLLAGPLTMELEVSSGFLRYLRLGQHEVLRGIYVAVRDQNWGTAAAELSDLRIQQFDDAFHAAFRVRCRNAEVDFQWLGEIEGTPDGGIHYRMDGIACSTFLRNRIGFCVLHGSGACAGADCVVEHTDGTTRQTAFPQEIAPDQPFRNVRAISHRIVPGVTARVVCEGDTFETEDQRNWTDGSFKTYCTPLALPLPVEISSGTRIQQSVSLRLVGGAPAKLSPRPLDMGSARPPVALRFGPVYPLPPIGLCVASHGKPLSQQAQSRLSGLELDHLRVDLAMDHDGFEQELHAAAQQARQIGTSLHVAVTLADGSEERLGRLAEAVRATAPAVTAWLIYDRQRSSTGESRFRAARALLGPVAPEAAFAMGTDANFAELNRERPMPGLADWICYSINPQVHAFDDDSLVETLEAQRDTVTSARRFAGTSEIVVSPVTLKPRFNAVAKGTEAMPSPGELPPQVDPRQATLLTAGWTLGSLAALASCHVGSVTYYETTGWRGVMEVEEGSPLPARFPSVPGCVFPVYHLVADMAGLAGCELRSVTAEAPSRVHGLVARRGDGSTLWLANLTSQPRKVELPESVIGTGSATIRWLDASNVRESMISPEAFRKRPFVPLREDQLLLSAHALARIDYREQD